MNRVIVNLMEKEKVKMLMREVDLKGVPKESYIDDCDYNTSLFDARNIRAHTATR